MTYITHTVLSRTIGLWERLAGVHLGFRAYLYPLPWVVLTG